MNTPTNEVIEFNEKVVEAAKVLEAIPGFCGMLNGDHDWSDADRARAYVWKRLSQLGIYQDEESYELLLSDDCHEGEARRIFCENGEPNIPPIRFKRVWSILKGASVKPEAAVSAPATSDVSAAIEGMAEMIQANKPLGQWTDEDLLKLYSPDVSSSIIEELEKRSKNRPFVVFKDEAEGTIDTEATLRLLKEARKRETPVHYKVADSLKRVFVAGDFPAQVFYECPLHPGVLLFDGYCDECGHTWEGVSNEARQFCRVILDEGEEPHEKPSLRQLINTARQGGDDDLKGDYPKVYNRFKELDTEDRLPSLKSRTATAEPDGSDPFSPGNKRY